MSDEEANGYCEVGDLLIGDLSLPPSISLAKYIEATADEMDAKIGNVYEVPIVIDPDKLTIYKATIALLRSINARLASGRIIMSAASFMELTTVHSYAKSLVVDALADLESIATRERILQGVKPNNNPTDEVGGQFTGTAIYNQDASSAVDSFYGFVDPKWGNDKKPSFMMGRWA